MDISFIVKNKKKIIVGVIILLILLIGQSLANSTYSLFYHEDTAANTDAYSTGLLSIIASSKGENISLSNVLPMPNSEGEVTTPYTFTIKNIGNLYYKFDVKLLSTTGSDITIDSRYIKVKVDDGSPATLSSLSNSIIKSDITLASGESIDISIRVWLSIDTPNTQIGKVFNSKIVTDGQAVYTSSNNKVPAAETLNMLNKLNDTIVLASDTPDFSTVSGNNGTDNNGNTGLGDGSIRMIYDGTSAHANGEDETDSHIGETEYNSSLDDNTYVGYMIGIPGAFTYADTHSNATDSIIEGVIDTWYKTNIADKGYSIYVADSIYCNDRSIANDSDVYTYVYTFLNGVVDSGFGFGCGNSTTVYGELKRNYLDYKPSLVCPNDNDKFTHNNTLGNGKLTYPVALITSDEVAIDFYLNTISYNYWTLTPWLFVTGDLYIMDFVHSSGVFGYFDAYDFSFTA